MQRSSKLTRHSHSIGVSDREESKRQNYGKYWLCKFCRRWKSVGMRGVWVSSFDFKDGETYQICSMMWADNFWLVSPWLLLPLCWSAGHVFSQSGQPRGNSEITPPCMMKGCGLVYADGWTFLPLCAATWRSSARRSLSCSAVLV